MFAPVVAAPYVTSVWEIQTAPFSGIGVAGVA